MSEPTSVTSNQDLLADLEATAAKWVLEKNKYTLGCLRDARAAVLARMLSGDSSAPKIPAREFDLESHQGLYTEPPAVETSGADYEEVLADHRRLVRELDVALNGDGAAQQASLCDIVCQVKDRRWKLVRADEATDREPQKCQEPDGCPTETAVLKRFWRLHQSCLNAEVEKAVEHYGPPLTQKPSAVETSTVLQNDPGRPNVPEGSVNDPTAAPGSPETQPGEPI